jgi:exodeoxyribonuclease V alpha subunit
MIVSATHGSVIFGFWVLFWVLLQPKICEPIFSHKFATSSSFHRTFSVENNVNMASLSTNIQYTYEQKAVIEYAKIWGFTILQGGPGTGKTTVIKGILSALPPNENVLLCAPTGNAAKRIEASTGSYAYICHKIIHDMKLMNKNKKCNLIIDESSMVSISLFTSLVKGLDPKRVILVGDTHQLPCMIGHSILTTLLEVEDMPIFRLTINQRQGSGALLRTIHMLADGKGEEVQQDEKFEVITCATDRQVMDRAVELYEPNKTQYLAFTNQICQQINVRTANNKKAQVAEGVHVYDRIVCTRNLYSKPTRGVEFEKILLVANGTMGKVETSQVISYDNHYRDRKHRTKGFATTFIAARAMTIHKSQGNEFQETGIIVLGGWWQPSREFIYTALSRFKGRVKVIGTQKDIRENFCSQFSSQTNSYLLYLFKQDKARTVQKEKCSTTPNSLATSTIPPSSMV